MLNDLLVRLRDMAHDPDPAPTVGRALLDLPPDVWRHPVVRDYCAQDGRFGALAQCDAKALVSLARRAQATTIWRGAGAVAALHQMAALEEAEGLAGSAALKVAALALWARRKHGGEIDSDASWRAGVQWALRTRRRDAGTPGAPGFRFSVTVCGSSMEMDARHAWATCDATWRRKGVTGWSNAMRLTVRRDSTGFGLYGPLDVPWMVRELKGLDVYSRGWIATHLWASGNDAAMEVAQELRRVPPVTPEMIRERARALLDQAPPENASAIIRWHTQVLKEE